MSQNPCKGLPRLQTREIDEDGDVQWPEKKVVRELIASAPSMAALLINFAASTGLRSSEQRALQWKNVNFDEPSVRVTRRVNARGRFGPPKSQAGRRSVPIAGRLADALKLHRETTPFATGEDLVFATRNGTPYTQSNVHRRMFNPSWTALWQSAAAQSYPRCKWHHLRHFAISCWIEASVPIKQVQEWAGHASASITLDTYAHAFKDADYSAVMDRLAQDVAVPDG